MATKFFNKTLDELVAFCTHNEYIEKETDNVYQLYSEDGKVHTNYGGDENDWERAMAAVNGNRVLFPRDLSEVLKNITLGYVHCNPDPCLREFKRKAQCHVICTARYLRFMCPNTDWESAQYLSIGIDPTAFIQYFNSLDVSEETDAAVLLFAITLQKVVRCCDLKDPWGQLMVWRNLRTAKLVEMGDNWFKIEQSGRLIDMVQLPCVIPRILVDNFNAGAPVPFEKFYTADEALKLLELYYGSDKFSAFITLFQDGKLSRAAVLP